jgi:hypothetical protein
VDTGDSMVVENEATFGGTLPIGFMHDSSAAGKQMVSRLSVGRPSALQMRAVCR